MQTVFPGVCEIEAFQTAKVTFKVIQGHWYSIGDLQFTISLPSQLCHYLALYLGYYHIFSQI